jgi:nitrite reductase (NO-forming)
MSRTNLLGLGVIVAIIIIASSAFYLSPSTRTTTQSMQTTGSTQSAQEPTVEITLYAGETAKNFSFGLTPDNLTSPGPTLRFKVGDVVQIRLVNVGKLHHDFAITDAPKQNATVLFNARINVISPGENSSVIFVPNQAGEYYYICQVPGHVNLGMWGRVIIEP